MISNKLVSVAMTTYNGEKFLQEQLESILNQTYKNIELVICDDCSTDNTIEIIKKYSNKDFRIKYFINDQNLGYSKNFQKVISLCNGEYIALSDQDDIWNLDKIELCLKHIKSFDLICSNSLLVNENNISLKKTMKDCVGYKYIPNNQEDIFKFLCHKNFVQGSTILAKSSFLKSITVPDNFFHDYCFAFNAIKNSGITYLNKCTIRYRQHKNQVTSRSQKRNDLFIITNKNEIQDYSNQRINFLESLSVFNFDTSKQKFIYETIKYYRNLQNKNLYNLKYYIKNYKILYLNRNFLLKILRIVKKTLGLIIHKIYFLLNKRLEK